MWKSKAERKLYKDKVKYLKCFKKISKKDVPIKQSTFWRAMKRWNPINLIYQFLLCVSSTISFTLLRWRMLASLACMYLYNVPSSLLHTEGTKKTNLATEKYYFIRTWESLVSIMKWLPLLLPFLFYFFLAAWKRELISSSYLIIWNFIYNMIMISFFNR